jgi:hypothetical protein
VWGKPDTDTLCTYCFLEKYPDLKVDLRGVKMVAADTITPDVSAPTPSYEPTPPPSYDETPPAPVPVEAESPKRKRGRPKGSKNKPEVLADASLSYDAKPLRKRGRPKGSKNRPKPEFERAASAE